MNVLNYGLANYTATSRHPYGLPSDPDEALSYLQTVGKGAICVLCDCDIHSVQAANPGSGRLTTCSHLICGDCLPEFRADLNESLDNGRTRCSVCGLQGPLDSFIINPSETPETIATTPESYSTKMVALLHNIQNQNSDDKW
jgi:SWI/SNF-related matrix-associated actin-dependent regulator of chromatin subfamily A3